MQEGVDGILIREVAVEMEKAERLRVYVAGRANRTWHMGEKGRPYDIKIWNLGAQCTVVPFTEFGEQRRECVWNTVENQDSVLNGI